MLVQQVDVIRLQATQAAIDGSPDVFRTAVCPATALAGLQIDIEAELGGNHNLVADRGKRLAEKNLIREGSIGLRRVKQGDALVVGETDQLDHLRLVGGRAIKRTHAHAAEAEGGDFEVSNLAIFHCRFHSSVDLTCSRGLRERSA